MLADCSKMFGNVTQIATVKLALVPVLAGKLSAPVTAMLRRSTPGPCLPLACTSLPRRTSSEKSPVSHTCDGVLRRTGRNQTSILPARTCPGNLTRTRTLDGSVVEALQVSVVPTQSLPRQGLGDGWRPLLASPRPSPLTLPRSLERPAWDAGRGSSKRGRAVTTKEKAFREELLAVGNQLSQGGLSFLEERAVQPPTRRDYQRRTDAFNLMIKADFMCLTITDLEVNLLEYFDQEFLDGSDASTGTKLLSALAFFRPGLRNLKATGLLARTRLALHGWARVAPAVPRVPLPWPVLSGLAAVMLTMGEDICALACLLAADCYLRPGELLWLTGSDVVKARPSLGSAFQAAALRLFPADRGRPSKTHVFNDSVVLDSKDRQWMARLVESLAARQGPQQLFPMKYEHWRHVFMKATELLGLQSLSLTLYVLRHTGPAHDYLDKRRTLQDIQRRGRWALESSVRRYERSSRVSSQLNRLTDAQLQFCKQADRLLPLLFSGRHPVPPLPVPIAKKRRT